MRKAIMRGVTTTAVVGSMLALSPQIALAGGNSCYSPTATACNLNASGFPGNDLHVDADVHGSGTGKWGVVINGRLACGETLFDAAAPPQSWTCKFMPAGNVHAYVIGPQGPVSLTVRW
ncbi:hypothetical protein [Kibdelosporangium aridum]|uniref:Secreted protein n=1 Tax=Kibdelosporangium aridum TaxID=2030 RepID=A0A1W2FTR8_KIBAR|nr:hypothetical protein [Kibdelosporangium aridum]SMD25320.1 hypothetical protein SAMN05661093_09045 [Kibdelosporangium aridum]